MGKRKFEIKIPLNLDDSNLNEQAQQALRRIESQAKTFKIPVKFEHQDGYVKMVRALKKELGGITWDSFDPSAITSAMDKLSISAINTAEDLKKFQHFAASLIGSLDKSKSWGGMLTAENLIGLTEKGLLENEIKGYDKLITQQEKAIKKQEELIKASQNVGKVAKDQLKKTHQEYLDALGDTNLSQSEVDKKAKRFYAAGAYYNRVNKETLGENAVQDFSYMKDGEYVDVWDAFTDVKGIYKLGEKRTLNLIEQFENSLEKARDGYRTALTEHQAELESLKKQRQEAESKLLSINTTTPTGSEQKTDNKVKPKVEEVVVDDAEISKTAEQIETKIESSMDSIDIKIKTEEAENKINSLANKINQLYDKLGNLFVESLNGNPDVISTDSHAPGISTPGFGYNSLVKNEDRNASNNALSVKGIQKYIKEFNEIDNIINSKSKSDEEQAKLFIKRQQLLDKISALVDLWKLEYAEGDQAAQKKFFSKNDDLWGKVTQTISDARKAKDAQNSIKDVKGEIAKTLKANLLSGYSDADVDQALNFIDLGREKEFANQVLKITGIDISSQVVEETKNKIESQTKPEIKPQVNESETDKVAEQIETKIEEKSKPKISLKGSSEKRKRDAEYQNAYNDLYEKEFNKSAPDEMKSIVSKLNTLYAKLDNIQDEEDSVSDYEEGYALQKEKEELWVEIEGLEKALEKYKNVKKRIDQEVRKKIGKDVDEYFSKKEQSEGKKISTADSSSIKEVSEEVKEISKTDISPTGTEDLKENLKEIENQAEKTEQSIKEISEVQVNKTEQKDTSIVSDKDVKSVKDVAESLGEIKSESTFPLLDIMEEVVEETKKLSVESEKAEQSVVDTMRNITTETQKTNEELKETRNTLDNINNSNSKEKQGESLEATLKKAQKVLNNFDVQNLRDINFDDGDGNLYNTISTLERASNIFKQLTTDTKLSEKEVEKYQQELTELTAVLSKLDAENVKRFSKRKGRYIQDLLLNTSDRLFDVDDGEIEKALKTQLQSYVSGTISNVTYDNRNQIATITAEDTNRINTYKVALIECGHGANQLGVELRELKSTNKEVMTSGAQWIDGFKKKLGQLTQYLTGHEIIMRIWSEVKKGFSFVKELDTSMTTIYETMDITRAELAELSSQAIKTAKDLGAVSEQMIDSVNIYAAYGKTVEEMLSQATPTVMLANATQGSAEEASDYIQGVIQQYKELEGQETRIVNTYEKIGSLVQIDFPKAVQGMAEGVQNAGSVMREAGVDFELYAASLSKVMEVTRSDGSQISNAMKTIASRISRAKTGDEDVSSEDRSNASKAFASVGIDVYKDDGSYRGLNNILDELSDKWDTLTDAQRNYIAEQSAGVRNINVFNTMLETWGEAQEIANEAIEDSGYYLEVQEKHMESMQAKLNQLSAQVQEFWYNLINTETVNVIIDTASLLMTAASTIVNAFSSIGSVFGDVGSGAGGMAALAGMVFTAANAWTSFNKKLSTTTTNPDGSTVTTTQSTGFKGLIADLQTFTKEVKTKTTTVWNTFVKGFKQGVGEAGQETKGFVGGFKALTEGIDGGAAALTKFQAAALGVGAALAAIAIGAVVFDAISTSSEEAAEAAQKAADEYKKLQKELKDDKKVIDSVSDEYETLSKGVNLDNNKNISLTTDEYDRYLNICNQIADMYPSLIHSYDEQGNAILKLKGNVAELNEEYEKARLNAAMTNVNKMDEYIEDHNDKSGKRGWLTELWDSITDWGEAEIGGQLTEGDVLEALEKMSKMTKEEVDEYLSNLKNNHDASTYKDQALYSYLTGSELFNIDWFQESAKGVHLTNEQYEYFKKNYNNYTSKITSVLNESSAQVKSSMQSYLLTMQLDDKTYKEFADVDDKVFDQVSSMINNMTQEQIDAIIGDEKDAQKAARKIQTYVYGLVDSLKDNPDAQIRLDNFINLDTSDLDDVREFIEEDLEILAKALNIDPIDLLVQLNLDDEKAVIDDINNFIDEIVESAKPHYDKMDILSGLYSDNVVTDSYDGLTDRVGKMSENDDVDLRSYYLGDKSIVVSPILPDGTVLSEEALSEYINNYIETGEDEDKLIIATFDEDSVEVGKNINKEAAEFEDVTEDTLKNIKKTKDAEKGVWNYLKKENVATQDQINLLRSIYAETGGNWEETMRRFTLANVGLGNVEEIINRLKNDLTVIQKDIENVNDAISGSNSAIGLTAEQIENVVSAFSGLEGYDYDKLFESTASGVRLNAYELEKLNKEYEKAKKKDYAETLDKLSVEYVELCKSIDETTDQAKRLELVNKRNTLKNQIEQVQELASQYGGLTSAYTKWQNAQETDDAHDMYDNIYDGLEEIDELYQKDLTGTDDFKTYMQQFFYGDLDEYLNSVGKSYQQFYEENIGKIQRYFTDDVSGSVNFLNDLQTKGFAYQNELGQWIIEGSVESIAQAFGVATSTIDAQFKKLEDHEFKLNFVEQEPLDEYREKAEEALSALGDKVRFDVDLDTTDVRAIDLYIKQLQDLAKSGILTEEELQKVGDAISYLTAKRGELVTVTEIDFNADATVAELNAAVKILEEINDTEYNINLNPTTPEEAEKEIEKVYKILEPFLNEDGTINIEAPGAEEALMLLTNLIRSRNELNDKSVIMDVDTSKLSGDMADAIQDIQEYKEALNTLRTIEYLNAEYGLQLDTSEAEAAVDEAIVKINENDKTVLASLKINTDPEKLEESINSIDEDLLIKAGIDESAIIGYNPDSKTIDFKADCTAVDKALDGIDEKIKLPKYITFKPKGLTTIKTEYNGIKDKDVKININTNYTTTGSPINNVNGNAHAQGNAHPTLLQKGMAFAQGTWGAIKSGVSLVGELGTELVVRGNRWFTVGDNGAEFTDIRKGDIVFNHLQTKEIFEKGYVTSNDGRGYIANANGNAYLEGSAYNNIFSLGSNPGNYQSGGDNPSWNQTPTNNSSLLNSSGMDEDEFKEVMDWVEIMIDRLERKIEDLDTVASSAYKKWITRNQNLVSEFEKVTDEIELQQKAYNTYIARAESVALSEEYKEKIRSGKLQIEDITSEELKEQIDDYQEWYEKALDCKYTITDLNEQLGDLVQTKFDNVVSEFEALISIIEHTTDSIDNALSIVEAKGQFASEKYFQNLMETEKQNISMLQKEYAALLYEFEDAMKTGAIEEGSEAWYDMKEQIRDVESAIQDSQLALIEYNNDMWEMDWSVFEKQIEYIEELTKESEFLVNLLSLNEKDLLSEKNGKLTDEGFAVGGLHAMDYNVYMAEAQKYADKIQEINQLLASDPTNTILLDKKNEYLEAQREAISNANDEKMAIRDLIESSYNKMLEILQELIDKRKEMLQAEKDLYSYEKDVREQTKQITDYQKQLKALEGDNSEETKSRRQQLQESLEDAQSNLEETEYDRWISDQEKLMDDMYTQFEEILNKRLDNIDGLLQEMIDNTNESGAINSTINAAADKVGYTLTDGMKDIWSNTDSGIGKVVSEFNSNFMSTLTTTNEYINKIYNLINKNVENADKDYSANTKPATGITPSASSSSASVSSGSSSSSSNSSSSSSSSSSSASKGSFFIYKRDQYPKSKLNVNTSIIDRLKYNDFDPSWSAMSAYYKAMGGTDTYQGTYKQNTFMLNWMKKNGYSQGGTIGGLIKSSGEDGFILAKSGEEVLSLEKLSLAENMTAKLIDFAKYQSSLRPMNSGSVENNVQMSISLPNVTNYNEFVNQLQKDKRFEKIVQAISVDSVLGKNSLNKHKF